MAITGKIWSAVLERTVDALGTVKTTLNYNIDRTNPAQIAALYPSLSWDVALSVNSAWIRFNRLPQCYPTPADVGLYTTDEEAILDIQNYIQSTFASTGSRFAFWQIFLRYRHGAWVQSTVPVGQIGTPAHGWSFYPDANTYAETTAAPFGSGLGNGLIRFQALYWIAAATIVETPYPDPPDPFPADGDTGEIKVSVLDVTYIFTPVDDGTGGSDIDGVGDGQLPTDDITVRCWGFSLDGHDFYVLRLGSSATFVYDLTTGTWSEWESPGRTNWRAHVGQNWVGANDYSFYDTDIIAGDDASGTLWRLVTSPQRDERSDMTARDSDKITHVVVGGIQVTGRDVIPCNAVTLDIDLGNPSQTDASILLEISDDLGETWTDCGSQIIVANDFTATVEWRGLGLIRAPGRLFRFTDDGATVSFKGANLR